MAPEEQRRLRVPGYSTFQLRFPLGSSPSSGKNVEDKNVTMPHVRQEQSVSMTEYLKFRYYFKCSSHSGSPASPTTPVESVYEAQAREILTYAALHETTEQFSSRNSIIMLQSLLHNQIKVPIFKPMRLYSWYSSRLSDEKEPFLNAKEECFPLEKFRGDEESCGNYSFIKCNWCRLCLCFSCFYYDYHFAMCHRHTD